MNTATLEVPSCARSYHDPVSPNRSTFELLSAYLVERNFDLLIGEVGSESREHTRTVRLSTVLVGPYSMIFNPHPSENDQDPLGTVIISGYAPKTREPRELRIRHPDGADGNKYPPCEVYLTNREVLLPRWGRLSSADVEGWPADFGPAGFQLLLPAVR